MTDQTDLTLRATRAYLRSCKQGLNIPLQPASGSSGPETIDGRQYVVLRNCHGPFAVYCVSGDRLRRIELIEGWPESLRTERN